MATFCFSLAFWFVSSIALASDFEDARRLVQEQKWAEAMPLLRKLNESEPKSKIIAQDLAHALLKMNRREEAIATLKRADLFKAAQVAGETFLTKESLKLHRQAQNLLESGSIPLACETFEKAHERDSAHFEILLRFSQCEILDGNPELAMKALEAIERIHGESPQVRLWKARALFIKGSKESALTLFERANSELKTSENAALWYAEALFSEGNRTRAFDILEAHTKIFPSHLRAINLWIQEKLISAQSETSLSDLQKEIQIAQSRLLQIKTKGAPKTEERLGVELTDAAALEKSFAELTKKIENRKTQPAS